MKVTKARREEIIKNEQWRIGQLNGLFRGDPSTPLKTEIISGCFDLGIYGWETVQVILEHFAVIPIEDDQQDLIDELHAKIAALEVENNKLAETITDHESSIKDFEQQISDQNDKIEELEEAVKEGSERVEQAVDSINDALHFLEN